MDNIDAVLQTIWSAHGLGKIEQWVKPKQGNVNLCLIVNDKHVIRFDLLDDWGGINRFAGEQRAYETLVETNLPVPKVLVLDNSKQLAPHDYLIMTKLEGKTITESDADLDTDSKLKIAFSAGEHLATIHSFSLDNYGLLFEIAAAINKPRWVDYVTDFCQGYGKEALDFGTISPELLNRVYAVMEKMQPLLNTVNQGRFVHGDYNISNILQNNGQITGIIDFEWALSGDPSWDFRIDNQFEVEIEGGKGAFYAGYTQHRELPDSHWQRVSFYRIGLYLDYLATFAPNDPEELSEATAAMLEELDWLEPQL